MLSLAKSTEKSHDVVILATAIQRAQSPSQAAPNAVHAPTTIEISGRSDRSPSTRSIIRRGIAIGETRIFETAHTNDSVPKL